MTTSRSPFALNNPLTLGEFRELSNGFPDECVVVVANGEWYDHIGIIEENLDIPLVTLIPGTTYGNRRD